MKYFLSFIKDRLVEFCEFSTTSTKISNQRDNSFRKFNKLFAYWFFVKKERKNFRENFEKRCRRQSPSHLISLVVIFTSINEVKISSKPLGNPEETRR